MELSAHQKLKDKNLWLVNSWKNKWKLNDKNEIIVQHKRLWYYLFIFTPNYVEKFPYSSNLLVWLTDFWHFSKFIRDFSLFLSLILLHFIGIDIILVINYLCMYKISWFIRYKLLN